MTAEEVREARRRELRARIELLQGQLARSKDEKTRARLAERIRIAQGRLGRA